MTVSIEAEPLTTAATTTAVTATGTSPAGVLDSLLTDGVLSSACPSRVVLDHVTSKWGVLVLVALAERTRRWGELRRVVEGISEKMLASTLRTLERDGLVLRVATPSIPPRVDYSLTPLGRDLADRLLPLMRWVVEHAPRIVDGH